MSSIGEKELEEIYAFAIQLGKDAGKFLLDAANLRMQGDGRKEQTSIEKASSVDLVTQTDEGKLDICDVSPLSCTVFEISF
jgi:myo-inositol-1(or 4)-monophosphatase